MNPRQLDILVQAGVDVEGVLRRLGGSEASFDICVKEFLEDKTMNAINGFVFSEKWDDAYAAAHSMKGVAGNMGFVSLMRSAARLNTIIQDGKLNEAADSLTDVNKCHQRITDALSRYLQAADVCCDM